MKSKMLASRRWLAVRTLALAFLLSPVLPTAAETFLVAVTETDDGEPSKPPLAAREGIFVALFDADHIGFELPAGEPLPSADALRRLAIEAGAGTAATVVVEWHQEPVPGGAIRVRGRGSIVLLDALTGREMARVPFEVGNEGRERTADRPLLGIEIGSALVEAYRASSTAR